MSADNPWWEEIGAVRTLLDELVDDPDAGSHDTVTLLRLAICAQDAVMNSDRAHGKLHREQMTALLRVLWTGLRHSETIRRKLNAPAGAADAPGRAQPAAVPAAGQGELNVARAWARLVLGTDAGGPRLFLAGESVNMGTGLELRLPGDQVVRVRIEGSAKRPRFHVGLGGPWEDQAAEPRCRCAEPRIEEDEEGWPADRCSTCGRLDAELEIRGPDVRLEGELVRDAFVRWPGDRR